jgi:hypothetical protein
LEALDFEIGSYSLYIATVAKEYESYTEESLQSIIQDEIIPNMQIRRGREEYMSSEEVSRKLNSPPSSNKVGEIHEYARAVTSNSSQESHHMNSDIALEIADIMYYELQPNSDSHDTDYWHIFYGDIILPYIFCIIKYRTRLKYGDRVDYKEIESAVMDVYLQTIKNDSDSRYSWLLN